jgi:glycosyltransferase involved in cell wall biosynthesis
MVAELVEKIGMLIENNELRNRVGKAARFEVEHGKFSLEKRNQKLGRIFHEAISA